MVSLIRGLPNDAHHHRAARRSCVSPCSDASQNRIDAVARTPRRRCLLHGARSPALTSWPGFCGLARRGEVFRGEHTQSLNTNPVVYTSLTMAPPRRWPPGVSPAVHYPPPPRGASPSPPPSHPHRLRQPVPHEDVVYLAQLRRRGRQHPLPLRRFRPGSTEGNKQCPGGTTISRPNPMVLLSRTRFGRKILITSRAGLREGCFLSYFIFRSYLAVAPNPGHRGKVQLSVASKRPPTPPTPGPCCNSSGHPAPPVSAAPSPTNA